MDDAIAEVCAAVSARIARNSSVGCRGIASTLFDSPVSLVLKEAKWNIATVITIANGAMIIPGPVVKCLFQMSIEQIRLFHIEKLRLCVFFVVKCQMGQDCSCPPGFARKINQNAISEFFRGLLRSDTQAGPTRR